MHSSVLPLSTFAAFPNFCFKLSFPIQTKLSKSSSHSFFSIHCSALSVDSAPSSATLKLQSRTSPAEVSRTIMELSSTGTLSAISLDGYPLGIGTRFVVDAQGTPALCLNEPRKLFAPGGPSSFHVQLEQSSLRTRQCTLLGNLEKVHDGVLLKKLCARWEKKFGEDVDEGFLYVIKVERVLQIEDFEETIWVTSSDYLNAEPDPLRRWAERIVYEMDTKHKEDILRICNFYVDPQFQVTDARLIWVDRLGFDLYIYSKEGIFTLRIPFPREVADEKGAKSSFNSMFHLAWEVEKGFVAGDFEEVKLLKKLR